MDESPDTWYNEYHATDKSMNDYSDRWQRLTQLINQVQRYGLPSLQAAELDELSALYRQATTALARARTRDFDPEIINYLNQLVGRAHACVYSPRAGPRLRLGYLFAVDIPRTFRENLHYVAVAFGVTAAAAALAYVMVSIDYRWAASFMPELFVEAVADFCQSEQSPGEYFADTAQAFGGANFSYLLMINNIMVALFAFGLGVVFGLGTIYALAKNGLMLGNFLAIGAHHGRLADLVAVVIPHGALEFSAIFIAGGAGLMIGHALVAPGDMYRGDALRQAAVKAIKLALGTVPMFIIAALIEGLLSPQHQGLFQQNLPRLLVGLLTLAVLALYLFFGDRILARSPTTRR